MQVSLYEDRCTWTARTTRQLGQRFRDVERRMNLQSKKFQRDNYRVIVDRGVDARAEESGAYMYHTSTCPCCPAPVPR